MVKGQGLGVLDAARVEVIPGSDYTISVSGEFGNDRWALGLTIYCFISCSMSLWMTTNGAFGEPHNALTERLVSPHLWS